MVEKSAKKEKLLNPLAILIGLAFAAVFIFNFLLLSQNQKLKSRKFFSTQTALSISPLLLAGSQPFFFEDTTGKEKKPKLALVVIFSPRDCITCLQEARIWQELHKKFHQKGLKVVGLVSRKDSLETVDFVKSEKLSFPINYVDSIYIKQRIGIPQTPFKVLLDSNLTVVYLNGPNTEIEDQQRFKSVIARWCEFSL